MRLPVCLLAFACLLGAGSLTDESALRRRGLAALPDLLSALDTGDPDRDLRARRAARLIAEDYYRAQQPPGMRLVPGRIVVSADGVRMEGGFYLAVTEVTIGEFLGFLKATHRKAARWQDLDPAHPVTLVSMREARAYAAWRNARLPTAQELEQAATAGGRRLFPWGSRFDARRVNSREAGLGRTRTPGAHPGGRSVHGIADLLGNVAEWTETHTGEGERRRYFAVGGSYRRYARGARFVTYRLHETARAGDVGLRLARSLPRLPGPREAAPAALR